MKLRSVLRRRRPSGDGGSALIEFVGVSVLLLLPLVYLLLTVFAVQRGAFAASEAAREAGRAFATAPSSGVGVERARYAASLAFADQGLTAPIALRFTAPGAGCGSGAAEVTPELTPGAAYTVCVAQQIYLPFADKGLFAHRVPARVQVVGRFALTVDTYRAAA
ncbi:MAG TPA: hypothetical protein VGN54_08550 [Mycobacteriales bacterium]|nr:hypothetical protein [Mycobacteriales bacterium]